MKDNQNRQLYFLRNPLTSEVFYVGIGLPKRCSVHTRQVGNMKTIKEHDTKSLYIKALLDQGLTPIEDIQLVNLSIPEARRVEIYHIKKFGRLDLGTGCLTNRTDGGEWIHNSPKTASWKSNASASQKIAQNRETTKRKKSEKLKGKKRTLEQNENNRQAQLKISAKTSKARTGSGNPNAKPIVFQGIAYGCVTEAAKILDIKPWVIRSALKRST